MKPFYAAVHGENAWRIHTTHDDRRQAIWGDHGAVHLLRQDGPKASRHIEMVREHGSVFAVFVWYPTEQLADARRLNPQNGEMQAARVPVAELDVFTPQRKSKGVVVKPASGPSGAQIEDWFRRYPADPLAPLAPDPYDGSDVEPQAAFVTDTQSAESDPSAQVDAESDRSNAEGFLYPDEHLEGEGKEVLVNAYERDLAARRACIAHYGPVCRVCDLDFELVYGDIGRDFIHVHHLVTLASGGGVARRVDCVRDLRPVCPNCHAMLHRTEPPCAIEDLRERMAAAAEERAT